MKDYYKLQLTPKEELNAFPDCIKTLNSNRKLYLNQINNYKNDLLEKLRSIKFKTPLEAEIYIDLWLVSNRQLDTIFRNLHYVEKDLFRLSSQKDSKSNYSLNIQKAKSSPILEVINKLGIDNKRLFTSCPFHNEKTPSLKIYPESNTVFCFGCSYKGDQIKFVRDFLKVDFKEAIKFIIN